MITRSIKNIKCDIVKGISEFRNHNSNISPGKVWINTVDVDRILIHATRDDFGDRLLGDIIVLGMDALKKMYGIPVEVGDHPTGACEVI